jgi:hypothetical protein
MKFSIRWDPRLLDNFIEIRVEVWEKGEIDQWGNDTDQWETSTKD